MPRNTSIWLATNNLFFNQRFLCKLLQSLQFQLQLSILLQQCLPK